MTDLPGASPFQPSHLSRADLTEILTGLAPGEYRSRDLLPRATVWLESKGRVPVTVKSLGESLAREFTFQRRKVKGGVIAFTITPEAVAGRDGFKP